MFSLASIIDRYYDTLLKRYGPMLNADQRHALFAIQHCHTEHYGEAHWQCQSCQQKACTLLPCGHRNCPQCQHQSNAQWLERQTLKLVKARYFMVTFTLPKELRATVRQQPKAGFNALFKAASETLKQFAKRHKHLQGNPGMTIVLHTHSRRLDFHPHVHVIIPAGAVNHARREWRQIKGKYLFNEDNLAKVFRAKTIHELNQLGFTFQSGAPSQWVVHCKAVGKGLPALQYLSRYLYRGVISEQQILQDDGERVTFQYLNSETKQYHTRSLKGEDFLWLLLQHVLPKGFRRVRDYGFLHGNAKVTLRVIQWIFRCIPEPNANKRKAIMPCPACRKSMRLLGIIKPSIQSG